MTTTTVPDLDADVRRALDTVRDPELDEPVTDLGFVFSCEVRGGNVEVHLRLPTYFCAPNFAFLMVADAYDAVSAVDGIERADVVLDEHFASGQINAGVAARAGFVSSFAGEAVAELDELRADFLRRAVLAGTDRVVRPLARAGLDVRQLDLGDVPPSPEVDALRARRLELGLPAGDASPLVIDVDTGQRVPPDALRLHLGRARLSRVNIEANSSICRGMLAHRYPGSDNAEETS